MGKRGPKPQGKTETIHARTVKVYFPNESMLDQWKELAAKERVSLSKFLLWHADRSLRKRSMVTEKVVDQLKKENEQLKEECVHLSEQDRIRELAYKRIDEEVQKLRAEKFSDEGFSGQRQYDPRLIELLKRGNRLSDDDILDELHVDIRDGKTVQGISKQLVMLMKYGLVDKIPQGWRWKG